ncbi:MAG: GNAT family N-acetyltransferase [Acidimicrobiia bacterium]
MIAPEMVPAPSEGALLPPGWRPDRDTGPSRPRSPRSEIPRPLTPPARPGRFQLRDGTPMILRPLKVEDRDLVVAAFDRLSSRSRYRRFLSPTPRLTSSLLDFLMNVDDEDHFALVGLTDEGGTPTVVGVSRYVRLSDPDAAEAAVTVIDDYQGRGAGALLLDAIVLAARERGIHRFEGLVLSENQASKAILAHAGARFDNDGNGVLRYLLDLPETPDDLPTHGIRAILTAFAAKLHRP